MPERPNLPRSPADSPLSALCVRCIFDLWGLRYSFPKKVLSGETAGSYFPESTFLVTPSLETNSHHKNPILTKNRGQVEERQPDIPSQFVWPLKVHDSLKFVSWASTDHEPN